MSAVIALGLPALDRLAGRLPQNLYIANVISLLKLGRLPIIMAVAMSP